MKTVQPGSPFQIPDKLLWLRQKETGKSWLDSLPRLVEAARDRFDLETIEQPFSGGYVSYVLPAKRRGQNVVLKIQFTDRESRFEDDALRHWNGKGAIQLLDHEPDIGALLLEKCEPGHYLADDSTADKLGVLAALLGNLLVPADKPFLSLKEEAGIWSSTLETDWTEAGKPCEKRLVDTAISALQALPLDETAQVLLHQDLHGHNVLCSAREPWLAIDPKPLVGDPAFALSPIVRSFEFGHSRGAARYRLDRLSEELSLDRERARLWTIGQTMAWAFDSDFSERHFETVRWLLD